jgi:hypothetical protein
MSLRWSLRKLLEKYVQVLIDSDRTRAEEVDLDDESLMLTETDIARYERGEPVRMPIPKLRLLCMALRFSQDEISRILARVHLTMSADEQNETSSLIAFATTAIRENNQIKELIRQNLGSLTIEETSGDDALRIISAAITEYLSLGVLPAATVSAKSGAAMLSKSVATPVVASTANPSHGSPMVSRKLHLRDEIEDLQSEDAHVWQENKHSGSH